ncbi:hypothetical protein SETIT_9G428400v2 [Setaria italica]|uniref:DUF7787 domain-containing protein n=1 Tax=Setaria italica TaxID=4555 RepID=A0A368SRT0_SETIT|nr:hypothetical protein SETIT_9G428400v2 [Setaria italica]
MKGEPLTLEKYHHFFLDPWGTKIRIDQLNQILLIHGFIKLHHGRKGRIMECLVGQVDLLPPRRSTLHQPSAPSAAAITAAQVRDDVEAIGWVECPIGCVATFGARSADGPEPVERVPRPADFVLAGRRPRSKRTRRSAYGLPGDVAESKKVKAGAPRNKANVIVKVEREQEQEPSSLPAPPPPPPLWMRTRRRGVRHCAGLSLRWRRSPRQQSGACPRCSGACRCPHCQGQRRDGAHIRFRRLTRRRSGARPVCCRRCRRMCSGAGHPPRRQQRTRRCNCCDHHLPHCYTGHNRICRGSGRLLGCLRYHRLPCTSTSHRRISTGSIRRPLSFRHHRLPCRWPARRRTSTGSFHCLLSFRHHHHQCRCTARRRISRGSSRLLRCLRHHHLHSSRSVLGQTGAPNLSVC